MWKKLIYLTFFFAFCATAVASDIAISTQSGWFAQSAADREMQEIVSNVTGVSIELFTSSQQGALADWVRDHTGDRVSDLLILCGQFPDTIYPAGNTQPDGSLAELFLDDGNTIINTGDWIFYVVNGAGSNGPGGLQNMMDIPGVTVAGEDDTAVTVTADGTAYTPTLQDFATDRPFHLDTLAGDWQVELILAQNAAGTRADPVIVHNTVTGGRIGIFYQTAGQPDDPRGEVISEWINNWWLQYVYEINPYARDPDPQDGATGVTSPLLAWKAGATTKWHDVYLGTDETAVTNATSSDPMGPAEVYKARQVLAWNMWYEMAGWIPGAAYYWRVDEVEADGTTIHTGDVWSFTAASNTAFDPSPADGAMWVDLDPTLSWFAGAGAVTHDVYFGTDETEVTNGTGGTFIGNQPGTTYNPGPLAYDTTYYWRIDERSSTLYTGDVWSFTTVGPYAGALGYYHHWDSAVGAPPPRSAAFSNLVLTSIDPQINFIWGSGSPAGINADQFAVRWLADVEVQYTEPYTFWTVTDDGIRVWLDGVLIIDHWVDQGDTWWDSGPINLMAGQMYRLEMEYYENGGGARAGLYWSSPSVARQPIPSGALQLPLKASNPDPANGATEVTDTLTLTWKAGEQAAQHEVFFGTDRDAVANADTTTAGIYRGTQSLENTSYVPTEVPLEWEKTYYWKVNEANGVDVWQGTVWSFTVADYLIIDDFEQYDDFCNRIFYTWEEGGGYSANPDCGILPSTGNGTGSLGGYGAAPYAEQTITHDGSFQSMPFEFLNDGSYGKALYSETARTFDTSQNWTRKGVKALSLWFQGRQASASSFNYDAVTDTYTVNARSGDIWGNADSFHYVYKQLSGAGSIEAKVLNVTVGVAAWTKVGVMIREDLEPDSPHAFSMLTPPGRTALQHRPMRAQRSYSAHSDEGKITYPYWVKIERTGNNFTAYYSANGTTWVPQPNDENLDTDPEATNPANITMNPNVYIGLALSSGNTSGTVQAQFSNVTTTGTVTGQWQSQDIGIASNDAERLYVALEDSTGTVKDIAHPDPNAVQLDTWQEWNIALADFAPVDLTKVKKIYIGVGNRNTPTFGGGGMLYIDDIRLYAPRCVPSMLKPEADIAEPYDCKVDYKDLRILADEWLCETQFQDWQQRAAYWDGRYPYAWGGDGVVIRDGLAAAGYTILDADQLKTWMDARIADKKSSVVVFCLDIVPETVGETMDPNCTVRKYLDAGGKIVWYSDWPFYYVGHPDGNRTTWGSAGASAILGFDASSGPGDSYDVVVFTSAGTTWGLTTTWQSRRPTSPTITTKLTPLATISAGSAAAWAKHFVPGDRARGFIRIWDAAGTPPVADVISVAESSGVLAADLYEDRMVDFKDYAVLADSWLEEAVWP